MNKFLSRKDKPDELTQYSKTYGVYSQIISLQKFMATISQIYLGINAAIWVVILSENIELGDVESCALLGLLAFSSAWLIWLFLGITGSIRLRFILLDKIGHKYFRTIKTMGEESSGAAKKGLSFFGKSSWGKARWFWFIFPGSGLLINIWLLLRLYNG